MEKNKTERRNRIKTEKEESRRNRKIVKFKKWKKKREFFFENERKKYLIPNFTFSLRTFESKGRKLREKQKKTNINME